MIEKIPSDHLRKKFAQKTMKEARFYEKNGTNEGPESKGLSEGTPLLPERRSVNRAMYRTEFKSKRRC